MEITKIYPMDAVYDSPVAVPEDALITFYLVYGMDDIKSHMFLVIFLFMGLSR